MKRALLILSMVILATQAEAALVLTHIKSADILFEQNGKPVYRVLVKIQSDTKGAPSMLKNYILPAASIVDGSGNVDDAKVLAVAQAAMSTKARIVKAKAKKKVVRKKPAVKASKPSETNKTK